MLAAPRRATSSLTPSRACHGRITGASGATSSTAAASLPRRAFPVLRPSVAGLRPRPAIDPSGSLQPLAEVNAGPAAPGPVVAPPLAGLPRRVPRRVRVDFLDGPRVGGSPRLGEQS